MNECRIQHDHGGIERQKEGISSITKFDLSVVFKELNLKKGDCFLDIGCGAGDYSFKASELVENSGLVYALDCWEELIAKLNQKINLLNIKNMQAIFADITKFLPISDNNIDVCLIAMVLHGFDLEKYGETIFTEIQRVLKSDGRLVVIEMKKDEASASHPAHILLSVTEVENLIKKYNFKRISYADLGDCYIAQFGVSK